MQNYRTHTSQRRFLRTAGVACTTLILCLFQASGSGILCEPPQKPE